MAKSAILLVLVAVSAVYVDAHGRMWEPAGRGTEWRRGFDVPESGKDYNDMEGYCGGKTVQWQQNGGRCGVCGDNWADPEPREHEDGGIFDNQIITQTYFAGQVAELVPDVTANHYGWIEFRLCARDSRGTKLTQECFDQHVLKNVKGETRFNIGAQKGQIKFQIQLPARVTCKECVIQWKYNTGNDWGICPNGTGMVGCSDQPEQFYSCASVEIL
ncbi:uncharacterized protein [Amphiura filiformis]|uniref:uncharacterized protein isoform X2 n=1 Tax=Amphiura filiformis TaxID=82378 RepID=UPI003B223CC4